MGGLAPIPSSSMRSFTTPSIVTEAGLVAAKILIMTMMTLGKGAKKKQGKKN